MQPCSMHKHNQSQSAGRPSASHATRMRIIVAAQQQPPHQSQQSAPPLTHSIPAFLAAALLALSPATYELAMPPPAQALLSSPNARLPRTVDAALRRSIPAFNENVRQIQVSLEDIAFKLRIPQRKPWAAMADDLAASVKIAGNHDVMMRGVLPKDGPVAEELVSVIRTDLDRLALALERKDADRTSLRLSKALASVAELELLQAPNLPFRLPDQYATLPRLTGRAVVQLEIERPTGPAVFVDSDSEDGPQRRVKVEVVVDGYSAPLSAGQFVANVASGVYNGNTLSVSPISVLMGDQGKNIGALPLEILATGEFAPIYRSPLDVLDGELPVLPLSIYGSVAFAHLPGTEDGSVGYVSSRQFFINLYNRQQSGLGGLSFDEGQFGVYGYVTKGAEVLSKLGDGDVLVSAKVLSGLDRLVVPAATAISTPGDQ